MITVAVTNVREKNRPILEFIKELADENHIQVKWISPTHKMTYKNHQKVAFKEYVKWIEAEKNVDMLLVELGKDAFKSCVHEQIQFHIAVMGDLEPRNTERITKRIKSKYYIVPETYHFGKQPCLTYGWGKTADVSASSAHTDLEGRLNLQCCIQNTIYSLKGSCYLPKEFGIACRSQKVESTLAGIATMLLYGIKIGVDDKKSNKLVL